MESTLIRIDENIHQEVKIAAARSGKSIQRFVSEILRRELGLDKTEEKAKGRTI